MTKQKPIKYWKIRVGAYDEDQKLIIGQVGYITNNMEKDKRNDFLTYHFHRLLNVIEKKLKVEE